VLRSPQFLRRQKAKNASAEKPTETLANTAGKCNKPKSICKNKNTIEIIKWLSDCNCNDKDISVSLLWLSVGLAPRVSLCVLPKIAWERPCSAYLAEKGGTRGRGFRCWSWQGMNSAGLANSQWYQESFLWRRKCCELQWNGIEGLRHCIQQCCPPLDNWETTFYKNMFESLEVGGKVAFNYLNHLPSFELDAYEKMNSENAKQICHMYTMGRHTGHYHKLFQYVLNYKFTC